MRLAPLEKFFKRQLSKLFGLNLDLLSKRAEIYSIIQSDEIKNIDLIKKVKGFENFYKKNLKNYPIDLIQFSEIRWQQEYFNLFFINYFFKRYSKTIDYLYKDKLKSIIVRILCGFLFYISVIKLIRDQIKCKIPIRKQASFRIYSFSKDFKLRRCKKVIYLHFPRHKKYLEYIKKSKDKVILVSSKFDLSKEEIQSNNLFYKNIFFDNSRKINIPRNKIENTIYFFKVFFKKPSNLPFFFAIHTSKLYYNSFYEYNSLAKKLLLATNLKEYICYEAFEFSRAIYMEGIKRNKKYNRSFNYIFPYDWNSNSGLIRRNCTTLYLPNKNLYEKFSRTKQNCKLYYLDSKNSFNSNLHNYKNDEKKLLYLAHDPFLFITEKDLKNNYLQTREIAKNLGYKIIFRPHPTMTLSDITNIYGINDFNNFLIDRSQTVEEAISNVSLISMGISSSSISAIKSSKICFCIGYDNHLRIFKRFGCDIKAMVGDDFCNDSINLITRNIKRTIEFKYAKQKYLRKLNSYLNTLEVDKNSTLNILKILN